MDFEDENETNQGEVSTNTSVIYKKNKPVIKKTSHPLEEVQLENEKQAMPLVSNKTIMKTRNKTFKPTLDDTLVEPPCSYTPVHATPEKKKHNSESEEFFLTSSPCKKKGKKLRWTTPERVTMKQHFTKHLVIEKAPTDKECRIAKAKSSALQLRKPYLMKAWVNNEIKRRRRLKAEKEEEESSLSCNDR